MTTTIRVSVLVWALTAGMALCRAESTVREHIRDLRSSVPAVRRQAAVALGRVGGKAAVPALVEALGDPEAQVRREAAKALGHIKDARAVPKVLAALRDPDANVRLYAAYALGEIKDPKAAKELLNALHDPV